MKALLKRVMLVALVIASLVLALIAVALIPRENIRQHVAESALYLTSDKEYFYPAVPGTNCSRLDRIADSVLLGIAYSYNSNHPLESVIWSKYYQAEGKLKNESLLDAVNEDLPANTQYLRYWHGSLIFVRSLLLIWNIEQIYVFFTVVLAMLFMWLLGLLLRNGLKLEAITVTVSMIAVNIWFVPFCLEYIWMFLVCLIASIVAVNMAQRRKEEDYGVLFLLIGIVAGFIDFLTTETITLLIPLMLVLRIKFRQGKCCSWKFIMRSGILWGIGYGGMWALKWGFASIVLHESVIPYLADSFELHTSVSTSDPTIKYIFDALLKNIACLFPVGYGSIGVVAGLILLAATIFIPIARNSVSVRRTIDWHRIALFAFLGALPYIRYMVLHFHAWYHYFFTYRAQASSVLALCFIIRELVRFNPRKAVETDA